MLDAMSQLALDYLRNELPDDTGDKSQPWEWYLRLREERPELLFPYLVESARDSMAPNYYVLREDPEDPETAVLEQREFRRGEDEGRLPFIQSTGSQSAAIGPVIKRTYSKQKGGGPTPKIVGTTEKEWRERGQSGKSWSSYFAYAAEIISRPRIRFQGQVIKGEDSSALDLAIQQIPESRTCYLAVPDPEGRLPGEVEEYIAYLQFVLPTEKYSTGKLEPVGEGRCILSGLEGPVYPNALAGAGINLTNVDRPGVFPGVQDADAWKKFALSAASADLLYIFHNHMSSRFLSQVAGDRALLVPCTTSDPDKRLKFVRQTESYVRAVSEGETVIRQEDRLRRLAEKEAVTSITVLWADFGQKLENVSGMVTDVLPSRLREISEIVKEVNGEQSLPFPQRHYEPLKLDLAFNQLGTLLKRPGGKKFEKANSGKRLFDLRRDIAEAAYHGDTVPVEKFWEEVRDIAEAYLLDALERGSYGLTNEGRTRKGETFLTAAGWVRHVSRFVYFLRRLEVYPMMEEWRYTPHNERLSEFFKDPEGKSGIDSEEKAYAFLLGALFGKLMQVQAARGVNVGANALTWLRRFTITGKDLPELYVKIRGKLLTYGTESNAGVRAVVEELGHLGSSLGTDIRLNQTETAYFLLLGQSLSGTIMPRRESEEREEIAR